MSDAGEGRAPAGWYPDPWTPSRRRYWTGSTWTFATTDAVPVDHPPPEDAVPLAEGHRLPDPVAPRPAAVDATPGPAAPARQKKWKWALAVVVGLFVGGAGVLLSNRSSPDSASGPAPSATDPSALTTTVPPLGSAAGDDPSAAALGALIVKPEDVPSTADVVLFPGGVGLGQPTADLCNGTYPSESRRTARIQDAVLDAQGVFVLSTEAVLYRDSGGPTQVFSELRSVVAACPSTPVPSPVGQPTATFRFNPPPDAGWPQTPSVDRVAFDVVSEDGSGPPRRTVAVYMRRGRALLAVYFAQPEGTQISVEGQTTIEGIVGVFAARLAALPTSVVGS